jgi:hypothetical protein
MGVATRLNGMTSRAYAVIDSMDGSADIFDAHRSRLFGIAYRMLGSRADAEDILQETYLRWTESNISELRSIEAWLVSVLTRLCIDRLRSAKTERKHMLDTGCRSHSFHPGSFLQIGPWSLPVISRSRFSPYWSVWRRKSEPPFSCTRYLISIIPRSPG